MATTNAKPQAVPVQLCCPNCGSEDLATLERLWGSAHGHAKLYIDPDGSIRTDFDHDGYTDVAWDSSTSVGVKCRSCLWDYEGDGYLEQLRPDLPEVG